MNRLDGLIAPLGAVVFLLGLGAMTACGPRAPTQLLIRVDSDMAPGTELSAVQITARRDGASSPMYTQRFDLAMNRFTLPGEVVINARDANDARRVIVDITAVTPDGSGDFTQSAVVRFSAGHALLLDMYLASRCRDASTRAMCGAGMTCSAAGCTDVTREGLPTVGDAGVEAAVDDTGCAPQWQCRVGCVDLGNDHDNCGACDHRCGVDEACSAAMCCPAGQYRCGDACTDLDNDPAHCGDCNWACAAGTSCVRGVCPIPNDECANALPLTLTPNARTTITSNVRDATDSVNSCSAFADQFFSFTLSQQELVYADLFSPAGEDTSFIAFEAPGCAASGVQCGQVQCPRQAVVVGRQWAVLASGAHVIQLDSDRSYPASGAPQFHLSLNVDHFPVAGATPTDVLNGGMVSVSGTTAGAMNEPASCGASGPAVWYEWPVCDSDMHGMLDLTARNATIELRRGDGTTLCSTTTGTDARLMAMVTGPGMRVITVRALDPANPGAFTLTGTLPTE